jgi:hypothetical protein
VVVVVGVVVVFAVVVDTVDTETFGNSAVALLDVVDGAEFAVVWLEFVEADNEDAVGIVGERVDDALVVDIKETLETLAWDFADAETVDEVNIVEARVEAVGDSVKDAEDVNDAVDAVRASELDNEDSLGVVCPSIGLNLLEAVLVTTSFASELGKLLENLSKMSWNTHEFSILWLLFFLLQWVCCSSF